MNFLKNRFRHLIILVFIIIFLPLTFFQCKKEISYFEKNYSKKEFRIPMRDGVKLFTAVYSPKNTSVKYPILIRRSPYSTAPYGTGPDNYLKRRRNSIIHFIREGYILVFQDVRGRFMSEGKYVNMRPHIPNKNDPSQVDESSDTYDTIEWLLKNIPNNNKKAGIWGISYPGFYAAMSTINAHPALKAVSPQAPVSDWFASDDFHHNGAFSIVPAFPFFHAFGQPRNGLYKTWPKPFHFPEKDAYKFYLKLGALKNVNKKYFHEKMDFWNKIMRHGVKDKFWQEKNIRPHLKGIKPAVLVVGGWFDAENAFGALETYRSIEQESPASDNRIVIGPWYHGGWVRSDGSRLGDIDFGSKTGRFYVKNIELPFFNHYLKGAQKPGLPEAYVFETGSNHWHKYDEWPPKNSKSMKLFLHPRKFLSFNKPENRNIFFDEFTDDPANPVRYTNEISIKYPKHFMVEDQRFVSGRSDVLSYSSKILKQDITIAGPLTVDLYVSSSGTDADWVVKIIDVFPDGTDKMSGYMMLVRGEIMRGKFRNSLEKVEPMEPGKITHITFRLVDIFHAFRKGHRIMVQIQGSWFPLFDRNPHKFMDIYNASDADFKPAIQKVYISKDYPSGLKIFMLKN